MIQMTKLRKRRTTAILGIAVLLGALAAALFVLPASADSNSVDVFCGLGSAIGTSYIGGVEQGMYSETEEFSPPSCPNLYLEAYAFNSTTGMNTQSNIGWVAVPPQSAPYYFDPEGGEWYNEISGDHNACTAGYASCNPTGYAETYAYN